MNWEKQLLTDAADINLIYWGLFSCCYQRSYLLLTCWSEPAVLPVHQLLNKVVFVVSFVGNNGTFIMGYKAMVMDVEFLYHLAYVLTSTLGLFVHELFYSILVNAHTHTQVTVRFCSVLTRLSVCLSAAVRPDLSGGDSVQRDKERHS